MRSEMDGMACVLDWVEEIVIKGLHHLGSRERHGTTWRLPAKPTTILENGIGGPGGKQENETRSWYEMEDARMRISRDKCFFLYSLCLCFGVF